MHLLPKIVKAKEWLYWCLKFILQQLKVEHKSISKGFPSCPIESYDSLLPQSHFKDIVPEAEVEAEVAMFTAEAEEKLLQGDPDYVLDAIDDIETKVCTHQPQTAPWTACYVSIITQLPKVI